MGIRKFRGKCDICTSRAVAKEMAGQREIRYFGLHHRVSCLCSESFVDASLATLLRCLAVTVTAVSEQEADDELEAVPILRKNPAHNPEAFNNAVYFVDVTRKV